MGPSDGEQAKWEIVPTLKAKNNVVISKSVMTVVPISSNKILLVGGMFKDQTYSDDVILFDFEKLEFSLLEEIKLSKKDVFFRISIFCSLEIMRFSLIMKEIYMSFL